MDSMDKYFNGDKLYGDDFSKDQIEKWHEAEKEGYSGIVQDREIEYKYIYNSMNYLHGFRYLDHINKFTNALGLGSAYGDEFLPYISKIENIVIIEPSDDLHRSKLGHLTPAWVKPTISGKTDFPDNSFDLITCFGVLHHIPNVTCVLSEMERVLMPKGFMMIREPISTMGDWRVPRKNLTKNERGIPKEFFANFF